MKPSSILAHTSHRAMRAGLFGIISAGLVLAQDPANGWPRADQTPQTSQVPPADNPQQAPQADAPSGPYPQSQYPQSQYPQPGPVYQPNGGYQQNGGSGPGYPPPQPTGPVPAQVTIPAGAFITVRLNQTLSSDKNHADDGFSASLANPVIANGVVVAQRGQTLGGRVAEAEKAGRIEGTSKLRIQLTDLTLVDGQQLPIQSQFVNWRGSTSVGRDTAAVAGTTGLGAAIGAAAGWGTGAAIGAGAGAAAGIVGVLLTRGRPTVIPAESLLTFRIEAPLTVATDRAPQAFRYADASDYGQPMPRNEPAYASGPMAAPPPCAGYGCAAPPPPYYYGSGYYAPYWGPGLFVYGGPGLYYGPRFYGHRAYYGYRGYGYRGYRGYRR